MMVTANRAAMMVRMRFILLCGLKGLQIGLETGEIFLLQILGKCLGGAQGGVDVPTSRFSKDYIDTPVVIVIILDHRDLLDMERADVAADTLIDDSDDLHGFVILEVNGTPRSPPGGWSGGEGCRRG